MKTNSISFKSSFIRYSNIKKLDENKRFTDYKVSLRELDYESSEDICLLDKLYKYCWGNDAEFVKHIDYNFNASRRYKFLRDIDKFYILTANNKKASSQKEDDVLGLVQTRLQSNDEIQIVYMQVKPEHKCGSNSTIKHVGTAMLDALKKIYNGKEISLYAVSQSIPFYLKNGFEKVAELREGSQLIKYKPILNRLI